MTTTLVPASQTSARRVELGCRGGRAAASVSTMMRLGVAARLVELGRGGDAAHVHLDMGARHAPVGGGGLDRGRELRRFRRRPGWRCAGPATAASPAATTGRRFVAGGASRSKARLLIESPTPCRDRRRPSRSNSRTGTSRPVWYLSRTTARRVASGGVHGARIEEVERIRDDRRQVGLRGASEVRVVAVLGRVATSDRATARTARYGRRPGCRRCGSARRAPRGRRGRRDARWHAPERRAATRTSSTLQRDRRARPLVGRAGGRHDRNRRAAACRRTSAQSRRCWT